MILFKRIGDHSLPVPKRESDESAGMDLRCVYPFRIMPGEKFVVGTGFAVQLPYGTVGLVCSRSGMAASLKVVVLNAPGIIDSDYRGEIKVILINHSNLPNSFEEGSRIAQLVVVPVNMDDIQEVAELGQTDRGDGGLGSTGAA